MVEGIKVLGCTFVTSLQTSNSPLIHVALGEAKNLCDAVVLCQTILCLFGSRFPHVGHRCGLGPRSHWSDK